VGPPSSSLSASSRSMTSAPPTAISVTDPTDAAHPRPVHLDARSDAPMPSTCDHLGTTQLESHQDRCGPAAGSIRLKDRSALRAGVSSSSFIKGLEHDFG
jgi:hypothetical protein